MIQEAIIGFVGIERQVVLVGPLLELPPSRSGPLRPAVTAATALDGSKATRGRSRRLQLGAVDRTGGGGSRDGHETACRSNSDEADSAS